MLASVGRENVSIREMMKEEVDLVGWTFSIK